MHSSTLQALLIVLAFMLGIIAGLITGILSKVAGAGLATAALRGGAAFGATVTLTVLVLNSLGLLA